MLALTVATAACVSVRNRSRGSAASAGDHVGHRQLVAQDGHQVFRSLLPRAQGLHLPQPLGHHFVVAGPLDHHVAPAGPPSLNCGNRRIMRAGRQQPVVGDGHHELADPLVLQLDPHADPVAGRLDRLLPQQRHADPAVGHLLGQQEQHGPHAGAADGEIQPDRLFDRPIGHADIRDRIALHVRRAAFQS